jgi:hypothetical protein
MVSSDGIGGVMGWRILPFYSSTLPKVRIDKDDWTKNHPKNGENGEHRKHKRTFLEKKIS